MPMAVLGGIAGSQKDVSNQTSSSGLNLDPASALENQANSGVQSSYSSLQNMVNAGPGQSDVTNAYGAQKDLASMLDQYSKGGYNPTDSDISGANSLFAKLFAPQQTALNQSFQTQNQNAATQAALMGRDINDPVLRAKLGYHQAQAQQLLSAQQNSSAMNYAMQQPYQRLNFAQARTNALSGLATQAMANRQALASMGEGIMNNERNFRLATASHWGNAQQTSGGGLKGAIEGAMGGFGQDAQMYSGMPSGGFFGGGSSATQGGYNPFGMSADGGMASSSMYSGGEAAGGGSLMSMAPAAAAVA